MSVLYLQYIYVHTRALLLAFLQSFKSVIVSSTTSVGKVLTFLCVTVVVVLRETPPKDAAETPGKNKNHIHNRQLPGGTYNYLLLLHH